MRCWSRLLRVPWIARSNQSILKEINPEYSLKGLMLKLKLQYFGHLMQRANSLEKTLMLRKIEDKRRRGWQRTWCLDGITDSVDMNLSKLGKTVKNSTAWCAAVHRGAQGQTRLSNWTTATNSETSIILKEKNQTRSYQEKMQKVSLMNIDEKSQTSLLSQIQQYTTNVIHHSLAQEFRVDLAFKI